MERKRFMISMSEEDVNCFEAGREAAGMNKSAYIRLLIAEHEKRVPGLIKYKDIIKEIADTNTLIKEVILIKGINDADKMVLLERLDIILEHLKKLT
jgi:hypothetical protein